MASIGVMVINVVISGIAWIAQLFNILSLLLFIIEVIMENSIDEECICVGNWRSLVKEYTPLFGNKYKRETGGKTEIFTFVGVMDGKDDYYYALVNDENGKLVMASCVGNLTSYYDPA